MYVRTLEQGLHFFSVRGFKFDLCVQYAESILEMMCRGTGPSSSEARSARKTVTGSALRPNANGPSRARENSCQVQVLPGPSEIISCTLCYLHVPSLSPRIRTTKPTPLS